MKFKILLFLLLLIFCGNNHIIERGAGNYFPLRENLWWQYVSDGDTIFVEVETRDTILEQECYLVDRNGEVNYYTKTDNGSIAQYVKQVYNFGGDDYTIIEGYVLRLELPLITGNTFQDSLLDSVQVADQWIWGSYKIQGKVCGYQGDSLYGDVYKVETQIFAVIITPDTIISDTTDLIEYYAADIGLVRFNGVAGEYQLAEYGE